MRSLLAVSLATAIAATRIRANVAFLASDLMEGRPARAATSWRRSTPATSSAGPSENSDMIIRTIAL